MPTFTQIKRWIIGDPLASAREKHERLSIPIALAVFASDALSSTAYATEEILIALVATGYALFSNLLSLPVALCIGLLMAIVVMSYRQVIKAYPEGGGTYEVSKEHLGILASQVAGGALLIDYVLTVAVSVSAGVAAITSTGLVDHEARVILALIAIVIITLVNLRGTRESGRMFAIPAYVFISLMAILLVTGGLTLFVDGGLPFVFGSMFQEIHSGAADAKITGDEAGSTFVSLALLLVLLKAFSHGCAALTGIEAISDGVKAFKEPSSENANKTLVIMACILCTIFLGVTFLAFGYGVVPVHDETVVSQVARMTFGDGSILYFAIQIVTMVILILAANTSFSGFPRLATILAQDGFLPRQLMSLGDRLVFSNGIIALGLMSMFLVWLYQADTHSLIPLYAVGVFLSFTLAQAGMVLHHYRSRHGHHGVGDLHPDAMNADWTPRGEVEAQQEAADDVAAESSQGHSNPQWKSGLIINGFGACTTGVVTIILAVEKFTEGAWIVLVAIPLLILMFRVIHGHYQSIRKQLFLPDVGYCPRQFTHTALVLVSSLHKGTIPALEYAKAISNDVEAVHVELNPYITGHLRKVWDEWGCGVPLTILKSPYRSVAEPIMNYIDEVEQRTPGNMVTIIVPEFVTKRWWHNLLHNQTSLLLKTLLRFRKGKVVTTVRYYLDE